MKILLVLTLFISFSLHADSTCRWENREHQPFETRGYTWGGGEFSTFEECQRVVRITIIALEDYFKDFEGELTFTEKSGEIKTCELKRINFPFTNAPAGFNEMVYEAFYGRSNPQAFQQYAPYIDSNFSDYCE